MREPAHSFKIINWGNVGEPVVGAWGKYQEWITIMTDSRYGPFNYPYKEPFVTWVAWCVLLERLFRLPLAY